jgi:hypothetical protein
VGKAAITIPLDPQTALAYDATRADEKKKIQVLLGLWVRELTATEHPSLSKVLDEVGRKAQARGLTTEVLDSLLKEAR